MDSLEATNKFFQLLDSTYLFSLTSYLGFFFFFMHSELLLVWQTHLDLAASVPLYLLKFPSLSMFSKLYPFFNAQFK